MKVLSRFCYVFAGACALASSAQAQVPNLVQGTFSIETPYYVSGSTTPTNQGCMIIGNSGQSDVPSLYDWGMGNYTCGLDAVNWQEMWEVYALSANNTLVHVIKSRVNGKCLIRGQSGAAASPSLYLWPTSSYTEYCGFSNAKDLISNGQAAWDLSAVLPYADSGGIVYYQGPARHAMSPNPYLAFSPLPSSAPSRVADNSWGVFTTDTLNKWELHLKSMTNWD